MKKEINISHWWNEKHNVILPLNTKDELMSAMIRIQEECGDEEDMHINLDEALLIYIGDDDIKKAFENIPKWYA